MHNVVIDIDAAIGRERIAGTTVVRRTEPGRGIRRSAITPVRNWNNMGLIGLRALSILSSRGHVLSTPAYSLILVKVSTGQPKSISCLIHRGRFFIAI